MGTTQGSPGLTRAHRQCASAARAPKQLPSRAFGRAAAAGFPVSPDGVLERAGASWSRRISRVALPRAVPQPALLSPQFLSLRVPDTSSNPAPHRRRATGGKDSRTRAAFLALHYERWEQGRKKQSFLIWKPGPFRHRAAQDSQPGSLDYYDEVKAMSQPPSLPASPTLSSCFTPTANLQNSQQPQHSAGIAADARAEHPRPVARASESQTSPKRPRRSVPSKSSSAVPTLQRFLPTYWLPSTMTAAGGVNPSAADLLRQAMMQR
jgi:hypothetical protein